MRVIPDAAREGSGHRGEGVAPQPPAPNAWDHARRLRLLPLPLPLLPLLLLLLLLLPLLLLPLLLLPPLLPPLLLLPLPLPPPPPLLPPPRRRRPPPAAATTTHLRQGMARLTKGAVPRSMAPLSPPSPL